MRGGIEGREGMSGAAPRARVRGLAWGEHGRGERERSCGALFDSSPSIVSPATVLPHLVLPFTPSLLLQPPPLHG